MPESSGTEPSGEETNHREDWGREALHFNHGRLEQSPRDSQDRLFAARRQQAKRQHRQERREERVKGVILPLIIVLVIAGLFGVAGWRIWAANQLADAKMSGSAEEKPKKVFVQPAADEIATEVEKARDRYLLRGSDPSEAGN